MNMGSLLFSCQPHGAAKLFSQPPVSVHDGTDPHTPQEWRRHHACWQSGDNRDTLNQHGLPDWGVIRTWNVL